MTEEQLLDYAATNDWIVTEEFLPAAEWEFGMPTWKLTVSKAGELFAESVRFGLGEHHYDEILAAMTEWDGLSEAERATQLAATKEADR
jgi:hypothetical protein